MLSSRRWADVFCLLSLLFSFITPAVMVKENDFKKCKQAGFCKRNREIADDATEAGSHWSSPYALSPDSVSFSDGQLQGMVLKSINEQKETVNLPLTISFLESGLARVTVDEEIRQKRDIDLRHNSGARKERYNEAEDLVVVGGLALDKDAKLSHQDRHGLTVKFGADHKQEAILKFSPFSVDFRRNGHSEIRFNERGLFNMEHWRPKVEKVVEVNIEAEGAEGEEDSQKPIQEEEERKEEEEAHGEDDSTWWEESFGGNTDSKPRGPESVALDISFVGYDHVYGIPSHAGPLSLKETRGGEGHYSEPYRLYNLDVFEYILDSPMTLYGAIPFMQAHRKDSTVGVFWLNAAETWVDVVKAKHHKTLGLGTKTNTQTHWISESGLLDVFVFLGPSPRDMTKKFGELTGFTAMPQEFAIGYHQCRWNYISDDDVRDVDRKMDKHGIPYDVIWLDIEFADDKQYFLYDDNMFKDPQGMCAALDAHGRKLVLINDPHIKNKDSYYVSQELKSKDLAVKNKNGDIYDGHCWPGGSNWVDAFNPAAVEWWTSLFKFDAFKGAAPNQYVWNDMNEPSVFNGPETTMPKDNLHFGGWEHRDVHNLNGMTFHNATFQALLERKEGETRRPFVLTRSFFAGSQRYGAMWTGDNQASWDHLEAAVPMLLSQGISGYPFSGADVGGFFGNPDRDLQARWYQGGAFYPFFRGHAHIDARRREPYLAGEPHAQIITEALRLRYSLLPAWYTAFHQAHLDGTPIIKPMFYTHPSEESAFDIDDQLFVGSTGLLHKPVVKPGQETVDVYIPDDEVYYDYFSYDIIPTHRGKTTTLAAPLDNITLLMRGGHIFPRRDVPRRSSSLMRFDDYTLVISVAKNGRAEGELYVDDGETFGFEQGDYISRKFVLEKGVLTSVDAEGRDMAKMTEGGMSDWMKAMRQVQISKVVVVGAEKGWNTKEVGVKSDGRTWTSPVEFVAAEKGRAAYAVVRGLGVRVGDDWSLKV